MVGLRKLFPKVLALLLTFGLALAASGGAGRLLSDAETAALFGRAPSGWKYCQECKECKGSTIYCEADSSYCRYVQRQFTPCREATGGVTVYQYVEDCAGSWGNGYCEPTQPGKRCRCKLDYVCRCEKIFESWSCLPVIASIKYYYTDVSHAYASCACNTDLEDWTESSPCTTD